MEGVNSEMVLNKMKINNKQVLDKASVLEWVKDNKIELLITAGAGDIDTLVEPIKKILNNKFGN
jgi:UDP-N-acetylmuramate--alanine ligase